MCGATETTTRLHRYGETSHYTGRVVPTYACQGCDPIEIDGVSVADQVREKLRERLELKQ